MMSNLSIASKVSGAFSLLLLLVLGLGALSVTKLSTVNQQSTEIAVNWLPSVRAIGAINTDTSDYRIFQGAHILSISPAAQAKAEADIAAISEKLAADSTKYEQLISSDEERRIYRRFQEQWTEYLAIGEELLALSRQNRNEEATALFVGRSRALFDSASATLVELIELNDKGAADASALGDEVYANARLVTILVVAATLLASVLLGAALIRGISRPIGSLSGAMVRLAEGDWETEVPYSDRTEEIGRMARTVAVFAENGRTNKRLQAEQELEQAAKERRNNAVAAMIAEFERAIDVIVKTVSSAAAELHAAAESMSATAAGASRTATAVASASVETTQNVQTVSAATEELSASVREITHQVGQSRDVAGKAVAEAEQTTRQVSTLASTAQRIGDVVRIISDIAAQTNLLALNATIEAARAGDAGKGFAVVASEVKTLATQTAQATDEISSQIGNIQVATQDSVRAIGVIGDTINEINAIATQIASAVEEQAASTQEIARNVQEAARGTAEVSSNIGQVERAAGDTGSAASQVLSAARDLSEQSASMQTVVTRFLDGIRAA